MIPDVAIVVSPREWAERLHRFVADHGGARVRARVLDGRQALEERYDVLVAEDLTSFLTPRLVGTLQRDGRRVLGVFEPTEPRGRERLHELGVDDTVPATVDPEELLRAVDALAVAVTSDLDAELVRLAGGPGQPEQPPTPDAGAGPGRGLLVAVGGPAGAPGATEVAVGLAVAAGGGGEPAVVVDCDDVAPALAQRLGLPLHPNLRTAVDVVEHWSGRLEDTLLPVPAPGVEALCGMPSVAGRDGLRAGEVLDVLADLASLRDRIVVNVGSRLEELVGRGGVEGRYAVTREVLAAADRVVAVAAPTPVGLARLLEWLADVRQLTDERPVVVFNRVPRGRFRRAELSEELRRTFEPGGLLFAPEDRRVAAAAWDGDPVRGGPFAAAMDELAAVTAARPGVAA